MVTLKSKYMKLVLLLLLVLITTNVFSQRYVIIDRKLKKPLIKADTVLQSQFNQGYFAIEYQNLNAVVNKLDSIKQRLLKVGREKYDEFTWKAGATTLNGKVLKWTYGDRFNVALSTDLGNGLTQSFYIIDARNKNKANAEYLKKLFAYIHKYL